MEKDVIARKKAELILGGNVRVSEEIKIERLSKSSAGPGAGSLSLALSFYGTRVKKTVSDKDFEFVLEKDGKLTRNGKLFLDNVSIEPIVFHCPEQAFFSLLHGCIFDCVFCSSPHIPNKENLSDESIVRMIKNNERKIKSIALTSGVVQSVEYTAERMTECVRKLRKEFPDKPIGVEPYVNSKVQIENLYEAGATEIKINCECATKELFDKACPGLDYDNIFDMLAHAVKIFGKGHVMSNVIIGLGETEEEFENIVEKLCSMGVAPNVRNIKISEFTKTRFEKTIGLHRLEAETMLKRAEIQKKTMEKHSLDSNDYKTMCFECKCCDLVPFKDL